MVEWLPTVPAGAAAPAARNETPGDDVQQAAAAPGSPRFLDHLSSAAELVAGRRFREAEVEVLRGLSIAPGEVRALKLLALIQFKLGRLDEARTVCRELATALPRDAGIHLKLGLIALKQDRSDESVQELELSTRLAPDDARGWSYLGFAYARRGERALAAAAFRRAGQEGHAAELERGDALASDATGDAGSGTASDPAVEAGVSGAATAAHTAAAALESAFDMSLPMDVSAREPLTDPDRFFGGAASGTGAIAVAPLVGYAVSRLAPAADQPAWVGATARLPIGEEIFVRGDAVVACTGTAQWHLARRRVRGRETGERLGAPLEVGGAGAPGQPGTDVAAEAGAGEEGFFRVTGRGEIFVGAPAGRLVPLLLEDDILYVREDRVLAFEGKVPWEYGQVPRGGVRMLQFRGRGLVAIRVDGEAGAVKVTPERPLLVTRAHLLGWIGRVVAQGVSRQMAPAVGPVPGLAAEIAAALAPPAFGISCEGEGVVLVDVRGRGKDRP